MYQKRNKELEVIILYLGDYRKGLYLREISKLAKLPLKTTQNVLNNLEKSKILKSSVHGRNKYFSLNLANIQAKLLILQAEIYKTSLFLEKYTIFKTFLKEISTDNLLIIFGSFAKFKADKNSDVDLLIIDKKEKIKLPHHLIPNKIHFLSLTEKAFKMAIEKQETIIKEIQTNHVILNNHSFYINLMWSYYGRR